MSVKATDWPPGTVLAGRYRADGELGRGGMGVVLRAWPLEPSVHMRTDTPVAVKLMLQAEGRIDQQRFEREARVTSQLDPTGVCAVYDAGALSDGTPYIAMELLDGEDLDDRLEREGALTPAEAADIVLAAIDILAEAHLAGLVHRDLKPSNLFLARTPLGPQLKVLDFGIVKVLQGTQQSSMLTQTGELLGSPAYMSPEQLVDSGKIDHRSDIWALGVVLHELVSGQTPFEGASLIDLMQKVLTIDPPPLEHPGLAPIVARCLTKNPDDRFANLAEMALALEPHATPVGRAWSQRTLHRFTAEGWTSPGSHSTPSTEAPVVSATPAPSSPGSEPAPTTSSHGPLVAAVAPRLPPRRPRRRRWLALMVLSLIAGLGAVLAVATQNGPTPNEPRSAKSFSGPCRGDLCDDSLVLDVDDVEPSGRVDRAKKMAAQVLTNPELVTLTVGGMSVDGTVTKNERFETYVFKSPVDGDAVSVLITLHGAILNRFGSNVASGSAENHAPPHRCPVKTVLALAYDEAPDLGAEPARLQYGLIGQEYACSVSFGDVLMLVDARCRAQPVSD